MEELVDMESSAEETIDLSVLTDSSLVSDQAVRAPCAAQTKPLPASRAHRKP